MKKYGRKIKRTGERMPNENQNALSLNLNKKAFHEQRGVWLHKNAPTRILRYARFRRKRQAMPNKSPPRNTERRPICLSLSTRIAPVSGNKAKCSVETCSASVELATTIIIAAKRAPSL